jgi:secondary thiamine-phosphate synthase enzyme
MVLKEIGEYIGEATNNVAEYTALIKALTETLALGFTHATIQSDSELMVKQLNGQYRVKNEGIIPLFETAVDLMRRFNSATITHVLRERNKLADKLASEAAMKKGQPQLELEMAPEPELKKPALIEPLKVVHQAQRVGIRTSSRSQFVDITSDVQDVVTTSGITDGVCTVFVPHTTAGVTINENADPDVVRDLIATLNRIIPENGDYRHAEGNSDAHLKASMMGFSETIFVENGRLFLGTWQGIYFCEFDGPRNRHIFVKVY